MGGEALNRGERAQRISRREFLGLAGAFTAGIATIPATGQNRVDAPAGRRIVGSGRQRYEVIHDWLKPPDSILWGDTHGVAQDSKGRIYVAHTVHPDSPSRHAIVVFDKNGTFLTSWGERFAGGAHGIEARKEGREEFLYHCDIAHRKVVKTKLDGTVVWEKDAPEESGLYRKGEPFVPTNIAFAPDGDFYVADGYGSDWIHQYRLDGSYVRSFGGRGTEPGRFRTAHGIWLDNRGREPLLVITDRTNNRFQYFTLDGKYVSGATTGMRLPCNFDVRGDMMVVADLKSVVTLLDRDNRVMAQLCDGDPSNLRNAPREQFIPGKFIHPHDAIFLQNGDILVAEWVPIGRITLLKRV